MEHLSAEDHVRQAVADATSPAARATAFVDACRQHGIVGDQKESLFQSVFMRPENNRYVRNTGIAVRGWGRPLSCRQQFLFASSHGVI
jgi:hypothetical protein